MKVYIHVGLAKTGTTFLQKNIFSKLEGIDFFSKKIGNPFKINSYFYSDTKKILISEESLSGLAHYDYNKTREHAIKNIKWLFSNAKIIIVKRNDDSWVKSNYSQYLKNGGIKTYDDYKTYYKKGDNDKYIKHLKDNFKCVLVLNYEDLKNKPDFFLSKLCDFIGCPIPHNIEWEIKNKSLDNLAKERIRKYNRYFKHPHYNPNGFFNKKLSLLYWQSEIRNILGRFIKFKDG